MKKTVSVNIKGINFLIEEDAYELLQDYMDRLAKTLNKSDESTEIIEDVELRVAEICSTKINDSKTVVELEDIKEILAQLGQPSDYIDEDLENPENGEKKTEQHTHEEFKTSKERRLFRDGENAVIAGVCQGVANFFKIDVVIIRAIFIVMFLFGGFGFPLYIIMWIIVPKAKSTIDRLRMKGIPVTVENVREEVENAAERIKNGSKRLSEKIRGNEHYQTGVSRGARILASLLGIFLIGWGLVMLIIFMVFGVGGFQFIPAQTDHGFLSASEFGSIVLSQSSDSTWAWIGGLLISFSIILFLFLLGIMLIARIKNKWAKLSLLGLFITGLSGGFICLYLGIKTGRDFAIERKDGRTIGTVDADMLTIIPQLNQHGNTSNYNMRGENQLSLVSMDEQNIMMSGVHFEYKRSSDSLFHVYQNLTARGHSYKDAISRARNIKHSINIQGDSLFVDTEYKFSRKDKLRDQEVYVIIEIPNSSSVRINHRTINLGNDRIEEEYDYQQFSEDGYLNGEGDYDHWKYN